MARISEREMVLRVNSLLRRNGSCLVRWDDEKLQPWKRRVEKATARYRAAQAAGRWTWAVLWGAYANRAPRPRNVVEQKTGRRMYSVENPEEYARGMRAIGDDDIVDTAMVDDHEVWG